MTVRLTALLAAIVFATGALADDCTCTAAFDALTRQLETNYLAYRLDATARARYLKAKPSFQRRAQQTDAADCYRVLQPLVALFRDGHLFVGELPRLAPEEAARLAAAAPSLDLNEAAIRAAIEKRRDRDPIEGIWYASDGSRYGIIERAKRKFTAIVMQTSVANWKAGQIKAEFAKLDDGTYDVTLYNDDHAPVHPAVYARDARGGAAIRYGLLLHMPPITWGKEFPVTGSFLDPKDPRAPTFRMFDPKTAVFFIPSHSPEHRPALEALIEANREKIANAETLIIDIRGNEGGSSHMTMPLEPFYRSARKTPREADGTVALSSPDNIKGFQNMAENGWPSKEFVERLKASPGAVVALDPTGSIEPEEPATPLPLPKHVAIVVDGAVVSAGEAFVMMVRPLAKVTIFGENTGGMIDYQSVWMRRIGCPSVGLMIGYPRFAASADLPRGGVNATGIAPDVRIPRNVDPIRFIAGYFARK